MVISMDNDTSRVCSCTIINIPKWWGQIGILGCYQGPIEFCADIDQHFARIIYTHHSNCFAEAGRLSPRIEQIEMTPKLGTQIYN